MLHAHGISTLVDIRAFPASRRLPHFNRESLEVELPKHGVAYIWMKELGGRRKKIRDDSPNTGLRSDSFRNYADYMLTEEFEEAIQRLLQIAEGTTGPSTPRPPHPAQQDRRDHAGAPLRMTTEADVPVTKEVMVARTAIMCAERLYFQCHRMLVSDYLTAHGHTVLHIEDEKRSLRLHKLMPEAHLVKGRLVYNAQQLPFPPSKTASARE